MPLQSFNNFFKLILLFLTACTGSTSIKDGTKTIHFPNSDKIEQTIEYKNGKKNGKLKEFYLNGKLKIEQNYKNDTLNDSCFTYYKNGKISEIQYFKNNLKDGCWKKYTTHGTLFSEITFKDDILNGPSNTYTYKTQRVLKKMNYEEGRKHGKQEIYHNNGRPKSITYFNKGHECLGTEEWYESGEKINNDFKITIEERDKLQVENSIRFFVKLENPRSTDEVYLLADNDTGKIVTRVSKLKHIDNYHVFELSIGKGGFIMEKIRIGAYRKTKMNNTIIKTHQFNASANNF